MNTPNSAATKAFILTDEQEIAIQEAFGIIHHIVGVGFLDLANLPEFAKCGPDEFGKVASRAVKALNMTEAARWDAMMADIREKMADVFEKRQETARSQRAKREAYLATLSEAERREEGPAKTMLVVFLSELKRCFAEGTSDTDMVKLLKKDKWEVTESKDKARGYYISVPFKPNAQVKAA